MVRLGQNFLADPNLLDAIVRDAELEPGDVVLEVGAGEGVLTERLAASAAHVHAVELDRGLEQALGPVAGLPNVTCSGRTRCALDFGGLDPAPAAMVANLPYSVATPCPVADDRRAAGAAALDGDGPARDRRPVAGAPGSRVYGSPSVIAQLACEVRLLRTVDPAVFRPARGSSRRSSACADRAGRGTETRELVRAAFAHRRKSLARSLEHVRPGVARAARGALAELGLPEDARAETLSPEQFADLSAKLQPR